MRKALLLVSLLSLPAFGCAATTTSFVESDTTLGRVVVYRNGVAYFERAAEVQGSELELTVPQDKVDDFLKSLTVIDAESKKPAPISYPTDPKPDADGTVHMKIQLKDPGTEAHPRRLLLTYVTDAPSWKPSYRIVLGEGGKVELQGWAVVDNTSGEDWKKVKLGVGSSSALSFRYDLHSVRSVFRETLGSDSLFAIAPPTGTSVLADGRPALVLGDIDESTIAMAEQNQPAQSPMSAGEARPTRPAPKDAAKKPATDDRMGGGLGFGRGNAGHADKSSGDAANYRIAELARRVNAEPNPVMIEGLASKGDEDKNMGALGRANRLRDQLIANGVAPDKVIAMANPNVTTPSGGARIVSALDQERQEQKKEGEADAGGASKTDLEAIGTSHFESQSAMTVPRGTSAMVSILSTNTDGEVVYLYDPESPRGDKTYPFRSVRLVNPTDSTLETGPVTVFGKGRFIGEGLTEPIPGKSASFVPFALDRQIVVEEKESGEEKIARILTVQRGILNTEMKSTKKHELVLRSRLSEATSVYIRHTVPKGYKLSKAPESVEKLGEAQLFRVDIPAGGKVEVTIEEETPVLRSVDVRSSAGMDLVRAYLSSASLDAELAAKMKPLLELQKDIGNVDQRIDTAREQMGEYRTRMDELHAQLVTLKLVKTAGPLMKSLEKKLEEVSDKLSKATVDLVALEEQRMVSRIKLEDGIAELTLVKDEKRVAQKGAE
jgi:hypothetical protein